MTEQRDIERAARAIEDFLRAMGQTINGELSQTGMLVAKAWDMDILAGEGVDLAQLISSNGVLDLGKGPHGIVGLRNIDLTTMCPHHLMPSHGGATVAYMPDRRAAGLGVITRLVHTASRRLVLQETLGMDIAQAVCHGLGARGALCRLELHHTCLTARGERQLNTIFDTISFAGTFNADSDDKRIALAWLVSAR